MNKGIPYINIKNISSSSSKPIIVNELPIASSTTYGKIYMIPSENSEDSNAYDEYTTVLTDGLYSWEFVGTRIEDKMKIVSSPDDLIDAEVNTYYILTSSNNVTVTLPAIQQAEYVEGFIIYKNISANSLLTISPATNESIMYVDGFDITEAGIYEINCLYNGVNWLITGVKFLTS